MAIRVLPYEFPDAALFSGTGNGILIWKPDRIYIVLGQSNTPEGSLLVENVIADHIIVTKRPTGGEAVVLSPQMIVITVARHFAEITSSKAFFSEINSVIIDSLADVGVKGLGLKGISDIAIGKRKILGSSMHRRENRMVYHAVLNISENPALFERYLLHPKREPDYRGNRIHSEFVTSLSNEGYEIYYGSITKTLYSYMNMILPSQVSMFLPYHS